jgi:hypothetical protein
VSGCLCVFCTRTGASTTPSPPSNGGPGFRPSTAARHGCPRIGL